MLEKCKIRKARPSARTTAPPNDRRRRHRFRRKTRRLLQAGMFAAVRGAAYALGTAAGAWLIVWLAQR